MLLRSVGPACGSVRRLCCSTSASLGTVVFYGGIFSAEEHKEMMRLVGSAHLGFLWVWSDRVTLQRCGPQAAAAALMGGAAWTRLSGNGPEVSCLQRSVSSRTSKRDRADIPCASPLLVGSECSAAHAVSSGHVPLAGDLLFNSQGWSLGPLSPLGLLAETGPPGRTGAASGGDVMRYGIAVGDGLENAAGSLVTPCPVCPVPRLAHLKAVTVSPPPDPLGPARLPFERGVKHLPLREMH